MAEELPQRQVFVAFEVVVADGRNKRRRAFQCTAHLAIEERPVTFVRSLFHKISVEDDDVRFLSRDSLQHRPPILQAP